MPAGLLHSVSSPDYDTWIAASEVLECATIKGAKSALLGHETGSLEAGKKADLVILDLNTAPFTPRNDLRNHLVYCENGSSIETVMVNGEVVVKDGKLHARQRGRPAGRIARGVGAPICRCTPPSSAENAAFHPHFAAIHKRCTSMDVGINRYGSDMPAWKGHNRRVN